MNHQDFTDSADSFMVFIGTGAKDATPTPTPFANWGDFVARWLNSPVVCHLESEVYRTLPQAKQREAKNTAYFCAARFGGDGRRRVSNVEVCTMVVLDVDDPMSARSLLEAPLEELVPWNFALWTTLTSTPASPRVRLVVESIPLSVAEYRAAVANLAARLGVAEYDPVSADPSHLWYRPTVFADALNSTPMVASRTTGPKYDPTETTDGPQSTALPIPTASDITLDDARSMLALLDPDTPPYWGWVKPLMALRHQFEGSDEAFAVFDEWSQRGSKYPGQEATRKKWDAFRSAPQAADPVTIRTLIGLARSKGWVASGAQSLAALEKRIAEAKDLSDLTGPCLRAVHAAALLSPLEVDVLLGRIQSRAKAFKAPVRLSTLQSALRSLEPLPGHGPRVVPTELQGYVFVRELNLWVHPARGTRIAPAAFDLGFSTQLPEDAGRPSAYALRTLALPSADREVYDPKRPADLIYTDSTGVTVLNTYRQSYPEADPDRADEAAAIFNRHLEMLIPAPENRSLLVSWMAWTLRNPGEKVKWHVFLQGTHGCGKSLLAEALATCFGPTNARKVSPTMVLEKFNAWAQGCCFAYFEEILIGDRQRDTMEMIKDLVTGTTTNIRAMRTDAVERPNHLNGMFLSNHLHGLRLERADRRFFCLCCAQQTENDARQIPREHFSELARLKGDLAGGLRHHLLSVPLDNAFDPNGHAPHTLDRDTVMRAGASEIDCAVVAAIEADDHALIGKEVLCSDSLFERIRFEIRGTTHKSISRVLTEMGYQKVGQRLLADKQRHILWFHPEHINRGISPTMAINNRYEVHAEM